MKFIFPQNYDFKPKLLGVIDYSTAILNIIWYVLISSILSLFPIIFKLKVFFFIFLCFPMLLFSLIGFNGENIIYVIRYIFRYLIRPKVYVFKKVPRKIS